MFARRISLLQSLKHRAKLCRLLDEDFGCRRALRCGKFICPLEIAGAVEELMNEKGLGVKEAYRATVAAGVCAQDGRETLSEYVGPEAIYPSREGEND